VARVDAAGIREVEFVAKLFVVAAEVSHQREKIGMIANPAKMRIILKRAMIWQTYFSSAFEFMYRFFRFAANRISIRSSVNHVMKMNHAAF